jgi:hypothetical protein
MPLLAHACCTARARSSELNKACCIAYYKEWFAACTAPRRHVKWSGFRADTAARVAGAHALNCKELGLHRDV